MTNLKGATRHKACYGKFGLVQSVECVICKDGFECMKAMKHEYSKHLYKKK